MIPILAKYSDHFADACPEYWSKAVGARSLRQLADVALCANGIEYLAPKLAADSKLKAVFVHTFETFADGRYIYDGGRYTSAVHFSKGSVTAMTTASLIIGASEVVVPESKICELHIISDVCTLAGRGAAKVYQYLSTGEIKKFTYGGL